MAKGTEFDEFALLSVPQVGLKREIVCGLEARSVVSGSTNRTRARKVFNSSSLKGDEEFGVLSNKRLKQEKITVEEESINDVERLSMEVETLKDVVKDKVQVNEKTLDESVETLKEDETKIDQLNSGGEEEGKSNRANVGTSIINGDKSDVKNAVSEKPPRRFTRSAFKGKEDQLKICGNRELDTTFQDDRPKRRFTRSALEPNGELTIIDANKEVNNALTENHTKLVTTVLDVEEVVMDDSRQMENGLMEKVNAASETPMKGVACSVLEQAEELVLNVVSDEQNVLCEIPETAEELAVTSGNSKGQNVIPVKTTNHFCSNLETKTESLVNIKNLDKQIVSLEKPTTQSILSLSKPKVEPVVINENGHHISLEKPMRRFTRSLLEKKVEPIVMECNSEQQNAMQGEEPPRRFTRSALIPKEEETETLEATQDASSSHMKNFAICLNCKKPLPPNTKRSVPVCNSCLETKKSYASPSSKTGTERRSKRGLTPKSSDSALKCVSAQTKSSRGKITRKDLTLHRLVFEEDGLPDGTELAYFHNGQKLLEGYKKGFGIFCRCCNSEISASSFEAHAGFASRRKPYLSIYTSNGVSLHELSLSLSKNRKFSASYNDDLCGICADPGDLLLCDGCPRAFHIDCVGESSIPEGDWYCPYCQSMFQREGFCASNANAVAAGRVDGVDPIEQISKRCIRIVEVIEAEVSGGCTLCKSQNFSKSGFGPLTVIICDQCEKEYHVGCLKDHKIADLEELPRGKWFCCTDCRRINTALQKLIIRGSEKLPVSLLSVVKKKRKEKCLNSETNLDVRWVVLSGQTASPESRSLLSKAVAIFHSCFDPIVDSRTGRDLIPAMIYGRNIKDQDFGGMYCAVLTVNSSVVSAGILRIFGVDVAELPLVATSNDYQGQGYFQSLFSCIERLLGFLNVKTLVLPAAGEAEVIWTDKFGFEKMTDDQVSEYRKQHYQMTTFQGTSMLQKAVPKCRSTCKASTKK